MAVVKRKAGGGAGKANAPSSSDPTTSPNGDTTQQQQPPIKVTLYDGGAMRGAMDDLAREVVLDEEGYEEDTSVSNVKIVLGIVIIAIALTAQFGLGKFPANFYPTLACVVTYAVASAGLFLYSSRYERDSFVMTRPKDGRPSLYLASHMDRYEGDYTLEVSERDIGASLPVRAVQGSWSVGEVFHEDGYLSESTLKDKVRRLVADLKSSSPLLPEAGGGGGKLKRGTTTATGTLGLGNKVNS